jgi:glycosyltransferase involved in cell wall biosynthesis
MRVLILSLPSVAGWGGSEELWAETARVALEAGHQVWITPRLDIDRRDAPVRGLVEAGAVVLQRHPGSPTRRGPGAEVVPVAAPRVAGTADAILLNAGGSVRELLHPDVLRLVHQSRPCPLFLAVRLVSERDLLADAERQQARALLELAAGVVLPARRSQHILERLLAAPVPRVTIVPSPVRRDLIGLLPWPATGTARFACVGRLNPVQKGQDTLLEAFAAAQWRQRDWRLAFVGRGISRGYLEDLVHHYGLTDRVVFSGFQDSMVDVWSQNELLLLPSREEGMPIAVMEAMYCGRPCLVTDVGDNRRFVRQSETGFVARSDRVDSLSEALEDAWRQRASWPELGRLAHTLFCQERDPDPGGTVLSLMLTGRESPGDDLV